MEAQLHRHDVLASKLADLLKVPKERRDEFIQHVMTMDDYFSPGDPVMSICGEKGNPTLEKAEHHLRGLLDALKDVNDREWELIGLASLRGGRGDLCVRESNEFQYDGDNILTTVTYEYRTAGIVGDILAPMAEGLADLIGRNPAYDPRIPDWRLHAILHDIRTWPKRFDAVANLPGTIGILNKILPDIVPACIPKDTVRSIRKRQKKERKRKSPRPL